MALSSPLPPDAIYGELFHQVQRAGLFSDQKTFADSVPKFDPPLILARYAAASREPGFDLRAFVAENFLMPETKPVEARAQTDLVSHLEATWTLLRREPDVAPAGSSLLPLLHPYIIPGGRFREIYYWDSYFTMLGLRETGREPLIRSMTDNLAEMIGRYGLIPNGNRTYYLTRSHPPVLALMVEMIAEQDGPAAYARYLPALQAELDFWNDLTLPTKHLVELPGGDKLHRYYDCGDAPRPESFANDELMEREAGLKNPGIFRHVRSAAESGWDFSSRWFEGGVTMHEIHTTDFVPVDLNCFLWQLEHTLAHAWSVGGATLRAAELERAAERRAAAIQRHCWSEVDGFYFDFHLPSGRRSRHRTLASVVPLFLRLATKSQAEAVARVLRRDFLQPGGLVTTLTVSGEQWDAPNGWAPLHWMAVTGLTAYDQHELAAEVARRWIALNRSVFERTGRLMEKYNVMDLSLRAGGGEYPTQDGFGWTNGVLVKLLRMFPATAENV